MFLLQYRVTKAIFCLFYKITKIFTSFCDVNHVSVLEYKMKMKSVCLCTLGENKARPILHRTRVIL